MSGFEIGGVDTAIARRHTYLSALNTPIKYFFQKCPDISDVNIYKELGIPLENMSYLEAAYSGMDNLAGCVATEQKVEELTKSFGADYVQYNNNGHEIIIYRLGEIIAQIWTMNEGGAISNILFYANGGVVSREVYWGRHLFTDMYFALGEGKECCHRNYYDNSGELCLKISNVGTEIEEYILKSGRKCNRYEFFEVFFEKLRMTEQDISILDRPSFMDYVQPLINHCKNRIVVFLHSLHYMLPNESVTGLYVNHEYYGYFKNSDKVDCFVVSSEAQKEDLSKHLIKYGKGAGRIEVIPVIGIAEKKIQTECRIPYSIMTASRFDLGKQISYLIRAVVKAHNKDDRIHMDIYGDGAEAVNLKGLIEYYSAWDYISLKGYCKIADLYKQYEVFATMSAYETYGITVLEAISSGNAVVGLNVRYGNKIFIQNNVNGFILDFDLDKKADDAYMGQLEDEFADKLVELFSDNIKLREFQNNSYRLADNFSDNAVREKWIQLIKSF